MSIGGAAARRAEKSAQQETDSPKVSPLARRKLRDEQKWAFGFRFFKEIKYFGLDSDQIEKKWLVSVMERLGDLSKETLASILESPAARDGTLRIHDIDWGGKNVPIARKDLDWIDKEYLENAAEFPMFQLAVSKALGRLVGFLDEDNVYQIVLLDPLHNAQPSKYNDYKVRLSKPLGCEVSAIRAGAKTALEKVAGRPCGCEAELRAALEWSKRNSGEAIVMPIVEGSMANDADVAIAEGVANSYVEIFEAGLVAVWDRKPQ